MICCPRPFVLPCLSKRAEGALRGAQQAAGAIGLQIRVLKATTIGGIDAAFASFPKSPHALFVAADAFFATRAAQFITLTARVGFLRPIRCGIMWSPAA